MSYQTLAITSLGYRVVQHMQNYFTHIPVPQNLENTQNETLDISEEINASQKIDISPLESIPYLSPDLSSIIFSIRDLQFNEIHSEQIIVQSHVEENLSTQSSVNTYIYDTRDAISDLE